MLALFFLLVPFRVGELDLTVFKIEPREGTETSLKEVLGIEGMLKFDMKRLTFRSASILVGPPS